MDILSQYEKQQGTTPASVPQYQPPAENGFIMDLVVRLSGGKIHDRTQISFVLVVIAILAFGISLFIIFGGRESGAPFKVPLDNKIIRQRGGPPRLEKPALP